MGDSTEGVLPPTSLVDSSLQIRRAFVGCGTLIEGHIHALSNMSDDPVAAVLHADEIGALIKRMELYLLSYAAMRHIELDAGIDLEHDFVRGSAQLRVDRLRKELRHAELILRGTQCQDSDQNQSQNVTPSPSN